MKPVRSLLPLVFATIVLFAADVYAEPSPLPPASRIGNIWNVPMLSCHGAIAYEPYPEHEAVKRTKVVPLPGLGFDFHVPQLPDAERTFVKLHLDDRSRGVVDHYILVSDQDYEPPFAAIVVTDLPPGLTAAQAFDAVRIMQANSAKAVGLVPEITELAGPHGPALELLVPDRIGTHCFPTSDFALVPAGMDARTMGISRFTMIGARLVEYAVIVNIPKGMPDEAARQKARGVIDGFWLALTPAAAPAGEH